MGKLMIVNGSPRAAKSHSKLYIQAFLSAWNGDFAQYNVVERRHATCLEQLEGCSDLLLVFPLYTDGLPSCLMEFLREALKHPGLPALRVHVAINCGFLEPSQNDVAVDMIRLFCKRGGHRFGACLRIGSGEGLPNSPFMGMARRKLRKLAAAIAAGRPAQLKVAMPLPKGMFLRAANRYWLERGKGFGVAQAQMASPQIEAGQG